MAIDTEKLTIQELRPEHWPGVIRVYAEGIATGNATFETEVPTWEAWSSSHLPDHRLVALRGGDVVGWAAVSPVSDRCCYGGVADLSIYVDSAARGHGVGGALLRRVVEESQRAGIWTLQAGIFAENGPSLVLHLHCGFRLVGVREKLGRLDGDWRDVLLLERRAPV